MKGPILIDLEEGEIARPDTAPAVPDVVGERAAMQQVAALEQQGEQDPQSMMPLLTLASAVGMSGLLAYILAVNGLIGVFLGRWMQALAFNPGGFGEEFRGLRLGIGFSAACFLGNVLLSYQGDEYWWWSNILAVPLLLVAAAVAHEGGCGIPHAHAGALPHPDAAARGALRGPEAHLL